MNMRIAACTVRAVAANEMRTCRNSVVGELVRHVTKFTSCTCAGMQVVLADGDFVWIVGEFAIRAEGTVT